MITIIGGGIGGLTTALAFEKHGIDYHIFEKAPSLKTAGAGIWLAPNALQVLDWLGILDKIAEKGNTIDRISVTNQDLSPLSDTHQGFVVDTFGFSTIAIHRAELQEILLNSIPKHKITLGKAFHKFEKATPQKIKVIFEDNSSTVTDTLIGADGIHSKIRKQLFPKSKIRYSGQTCWRGVADIKIDSGFEHRGIEMWGNQIRFGISRISDQKVYWFAVVTSKPNQKDNTTHLKNKLLEIFSEFHPIVHQLISNTMNDKIIRGDINDITPLQQWHTDTICLIGDACHSATPDMGQGGAQAIEDSYYLSHFINNEENTEIAFSKFQKKRYSKVNAIVKLSRRTEKIAHWKYGQSFRNFILKSTPNKILEKKMIKMYQIEKMN